MKTALTFWITLLLCAVLAVGLDACRASRPQADERVNASLVAPPVAPVALPIAPVPDSIRVQPHRTLLDRVLRRPAVPTTYQPAGPAVPVLIGKKSTVSIYYGPARITTTTIGKKAGPAVVASDSVNLTNQAGATNAVAGHDNTTTQTNTAPKAAGIGATIAAKLTGPLGWVLALAVVGAAGYFLIPLIVRRKAEKTIS